MNCRVQAVQLVLDGGGVGSRVDWYQKMLIRFYRGSLKLGRPSYIGVMRKMRRNCSPHQGQSCPQAEGCTPREQPKIASRCTSKGSENGKDGVQGRAISLAPESACRR